MAVGAFPAAGARCARTPGGDMTPPAGSDVEVQPIFEHTRQAADDDMGNQTCGFCPRQLGAGCPRETQTLPQGTLPCKKEKKEKKKPRSRQFSVLDSLIPVGRKFGFYTLHCTFLSRTHFLAITDHDREKGSEWMPRTSNQRQPQTTPNPPNRIPSNSRSRWWTQDRQAL